MNNYQPNGISTTGALLHEGMVSVFGWMASALGLSAVASLIVVNSPAFSSIVFSNPWVLGGLMIGQLVLVIALSFLIMRMSYLVAAILFIFYALITGVTLSSIFMVYTTTSIATTFIVAAGMFGAMALYGATTKSDLTGVGSFGRMVLFGLIGALLINIFVQNSVLDLITAIVGVILFAGLTAYDIQRIQLIMVRLINQQEPVYKAALLGALTLYLDFLNLFLSLLRVMGSPRSRN
jgi:FtsH-binding integral membrane protein